MKDTFPVQLAINGSCYQMAMLVCFGIEDTVAVLDASARARREIECGGWADLFECCDIIGTAGKIEILTFAYDGCDEPDLILVDRHPVTPERAFGGGEPLWIDSEQKAGGGS